MMQSKISRPALWSLLLAIIPIAGCGSDDRAPGDPRHGDTLTAYDFSFPEPRFPEGRSLDTILTADLDGNGHIDYIVTSLAQDSAMPADAKADLIQVYSWDTVGKSYSVILVDSLRWATSFELRDVTADRMPDILAKINAGGNSPTATAGISIFSGHGGSPRAIYRTGRGSPVLDTLNGRGDVGIYLYASIWPPLTPHSQSFDYLDNIIAFRNGEFTSVRKEQSRRFLSLGDSYREVYRTLREKHRADTLLYDPDSVMVASGRDTVSDNPSPLFPAAARILLSYGRGEQISALRAFWRVEGEFLRRRMPLAQFIELEALYKQMTTPLSEQTQG